LVRINPNQVIRRYSKEVRYVLKLDV